MKPSRIRTRTPGRNQAGRRVNSDEALLKEPVEVYCRIRPIDEGEERCLHVLSDKVVEIVPPDSSLAVRSQTQNARAMQYTFTRVFDEQSDQKEVFDVTARTLVSDLIKGKNGLLFAYGNTGSGKTYTMTGDAQNGGIMPRSVDVLFNTVSSYLAPKHVFKPDKMNGFDVQSAVDAIEDTSRDYFLSAGGRGAEPKTPGRTRPGPFDSLEARIHDTSTVNGVDSDVLYGVFITYVEIYNNNVYDLLEAPPMDGKARQQTFQSKILREDAMRRMYVHSVTEVEVRSSDEALEVFKRGQKRRRVAQTTLNAESSRSHSIFTIRLVQAPYNNEGTEAVQDKNYVTVSQLSLVDLAGCERSNRTNTKGDRLKEAGNINNTLMTLRSCIETLRENQLAGASKLVPYRDSKITHIFKSYFEGEGKIKMIVCVNPRSEDFDETILVMRFAEMTQEVAVPAQTTKTPGRHDNNLIPGRRRANVLFQEAKERLEREEMQMENVPFDRDTIFSLGTFPPHELCDDDNDEEMISNLLDFLRNRSQTRESLRIQQHARKSALRARIAAIDQEAQQLRFENGSLKGQLEAEIEKRKKLETDIINLRHGGETKTRRLTELERRLVAKEQELAEKEHQLKQAQIDVDRMKTKYTSKLLDEKERIQRRVEQRKNEETEQLKSQILARERQLRKIGVMALKDKYAAPSVAASLPSASSDTDLHAIERVRTESERQSRRDRAAAGGEPIRHRRSKSTGTCDKWLDHRPPTVAVPLHTVLQPRMSNRRSVNKLTGVRDVGSFDKYVLTTQDQDSAGELETKLYKGDVFATPGGGAQVVLNDVEVLKQISPTRVRKRRDLEPVLPPDVVEAKCKTGAIEGHGSKRTKR